MHKTNLHILASFVATLYGTRVNHMDPMDTGTDGWIHCVLELLVCSPRCANLRSGAKGKEL